MRLNPLNLLLVEDSPRDVELILMALEKFGLQIDPVVVYDHHGARAALERSRFDVIVCDFILPSSSGIHVLDVAKEIAPDTPFIFLSGMFGQQKAVETMRLGAVDYVLKQNLNLLPKAVKRAVIEVFERQRRRDAETALEEIKARAQLAIEAADMGVWELDLKTNAVIWDERCKALYELPPNAMLDADQVIGLCHPDDTAILAAKVDEALGQESDFHVEYRILLPGDRIRWLLSNGRSIFKDGQCVRFSGVIQDISERRKATQALVQLNETLGERVEQRTRERDRTWELSRELLAVLRFDMTPVAFNPAWESALGWSREHISGLRLWELIHPLDLDATIRETQSISSGNVSTRFVNRMRHSNGDFRWLSWTIVPEDGLMYAAVRDITDERTIVDELAATNLRLREQIEQREKVEAELQQMQRLEVVGQLTAGVAHDFNNLLTVILTSASLAMKAIDRGVTDRVKPRLQHIKDAGERGAKLTAQLLSFSRRQRLAPTAINLNATVEGMRNLLVKAMGASVWFETSLAQDLWTASADPTQTEMIILNLAINARDAMVAGGSLHLRTYNEVVEWPAQRPGHPEPGNYVVISVRDTGSGMSPETLAKAFEPFFTTKEVGKGSGLGLAQVFGFAKQSGGGVRIETAVEQGTTVFVYLPSMGCVPLAAVRPAPPEIEPHNGTRATIMLVDDDEAVRSVTAMMLESMGYNVVQVADGARAITQVDGRIDLVLSDYAMPGMNGAELAALVAAAHPTLPVIFITGYADTDVLGLAGASVIQKPFSEHDLQAKISAALA
ncbi:response regulator [Pseudomonas huanghezhanensis]|uniref:response regulator n=1 Tax=Pseudomonas huanghezhanensis TaxID=3002903 RepID=UPI0022868B1F|nr:response regulator [Pseudomonas sp. BSw22131]